MKEKKFVSLHFLSRYINIIISKKDKISSAIIFYLYKSSHRREEERNYISCGKNQKRKTSIYQDCSYALHLH